MTEPFIRTKAVLCVLAVVAVAFGPIALSVFLDLPGWAPIAITAVVILASAVFFDVKEMFE